MENEPIFTIHGVRGTMPVCGRAFDRYGGETTCLSLAAHRGILIVDAGTGIIALGNQLMRRRNIPPITIVFTHFHLDHVIGLPLFKPLYRHGVSITFMADPHREENWRDALRRLTGPPYWPLALRNCGASLRFKDLPRRRRRMQMNGVVIAWHPLRHAQQCLAYRFDFQKRSLVFATDHELDADGVNGSFTDFCRGASVLIADAQWTPPEYLHKHGWGHGTWKACARLAAAAGAGKLILTHHDRSRTDKQIDRLVSRARHIFPATQAARAGMQV